MKDLIVKTFWRWLDNDPFTQSASVAYYAIFSIPGLLVIVMGIAALVFDQREIENAVLRYIQDVVGWEAANGIREIVNDTRRGDRDLWAVLVGAATLMFGAMGLFLQLQRTLNHIWKVEVKKTARLAEFLRDRAIALGIMVVIGFLLLVSLTVTALLTALSDWLSAYVPLYMIVFFYLLDLAVSLGIVSVLFALIFKILPDAYVRWRFAMVGGIVSAVLFTLGEYALNFYFGIAAPQTTFGAAGSIVLLMLWVSYSCLILLYGAEFTKTIAGEHHDQCVPTPIARKEDESQKRLS